MEHWPKIFWFFNNAWLLRVGEDGSKNLGDKIWNIMNKNLSSVKYSLHVNNLAQQKNAIKNNSKFY